MIDIRNWTCSPPSLWRYSHMASLVADSWAWPSGI